MLSANSSCHSVCLTGEPIALIASKTGKLNIPGPVNRLHGTWIPPAHLDMQRELEHPIVSQPSLVHKIMASRFRHFIDIFTTRPASRSKTLAERLAFWILFSLSWVVLARAAYDIRNEYESRYGAITWLSAGRSTLTRILGAISNAQVSLECTT